ncbi:hypothetical protein BGZ65_011965, partial [Modicella reniformis]
MGQSLESQLSSMTTMGDSGSGGNRWGRTESTLLSGTSMLLGSNSHDLLRRLSHSSGGSEMSIRSSGLAQEMFGYTLDARIIQKKDQMEETSPTGEIVQAHVVEEIRTGQQFLIKLQLIKQGSQAQSSAAATAARFPTMRVDRRDAINTAGEPRSDVEPLTLQIIVHLAKSGQIRKGACAKCCHK